MVLEGATITPEADSHTGDTAAQPSIQLSQRLHALLPQTQCKRCGYADCTSYADAMASGDADLNRCAPGGAEGIDRLAAELHRAPVSFDPNHGFEKPRDLAVIDEDWCIGCTKCLDVCPTDAIVGASKRMHTVISTHCTGCELCVPVCPVDCIGMFNESGTHTGWDAWSSQQALDALHRYQQHSERMAKKASIGAKKLDFDGRVNCMVHPHAVEEGPDRPESRLSIENSAVDQKRALVQAALQRARSRAT